MFAKLLITTFVIDRTSKLSTHAPKAFQVNCCLFKLGTWKFQRNFCFKSTSASSLRGAPDIRALIKKFPENELKKRENCSESEIVSIVQRASEIALL